MRLPDRNWLTYCLNVHPGEDWAAVRDALGGPVAEVKRRVSPDAPFAVGLRLSARAVGELSEPRARYELLDVLSLHDFRAVTVNGFPYGAFHGTPVKEQVYQPDWRDPERLVYTARLAELMAAIAPAGEAVSLSTVPGGYKPSIREEDVPRIAGQMLDAVAHAIRLEESTGITVRIAVEPEPFCLIETIAEATAFFTEHLLSETAVARIVEATGLPAGDAAEALPRHVGLCYDVCHAAVEFEDPDASIAALRAAGVPVHKLQLSSALAIEPVTRAARRRLGAFVEPVYLHQVIGRGGDGPVGTADLPEALDRGEAADGETWRVHFHVPVFVETLEAVGTTQGFLARILEMQREDPISPHLEVETYTWDVLPPELREGSVEAAIAREIEWVRERLT